MRALVKGSAAGTEHGLVLQGINSNFIVDVGANRGQFALVARKVFPKARILSFEPLAEPIQTLRKYLIVIMMSRCIPLLLAERKPVLRFM